MVRCKFGLISVFILYFHLPISTVGVNYGEEWFYAEGVDLLVHPWNGIEVLSGLIVELPISYAEAERFVLFGARKIRAAHSV